jgi:hypothetical protein
MTKPKVSPLPHSWPVNQWPVEVAPGRVSAGRNLVRKHKAELLRCGALTRVGRELVILGQGYAEFLALQMKRVQDFQIPPNRKSRIEEVA